jgi:hypothetical protein
MEQITSGELDAIFGGQSMFGSIFHGGASTTKQPDDREATAPPGPRHGGVVGGPVGGLIGFGPNFLGWLRRKLGREKVESK